MIMNITKADIETSAELWAESFKTGEWFERLRKEAFIEGANYVLGRFKQSEQPEAITEGSHFANTYVGGSTANEKTTSLVNDGSDHPSETQAVGGNKQTKEVYIFQCKCGYKTNNSLDWCIHADGCTTKI